MEQTTIGKTKYIALGIAATFLTLFAGIFAIGQVLAAEEDGTYSDIVQNIATKFNLEPAEVQTVFDETKETREAARFDQLVEDGTITEDQKNALISKQDELETSIEEINNQQLTADERNEAVRTLMEEHSQWMEDNSLEDVMIPFKGGGMIEVKGGPGMGFSPAGRAEMFTMRLDSDEMPIEIE